MGKWDGSVWWRLLETIKRRTDRDRWTCTYWFFRKGRVCNIEIIRVKELSVHKIVLSILKDNCTGQCAALFYFRCRWNWKNELWEASALRCYKETWRPESFQKISGRQVSLEHLRADLVPKTYLWARFIRSSPESIDESYCEQAFTWLRRWEKLNIGLLEIWFHLTVQTKYI